MKFAIGFGVGPAPDRARNTSSWVHDTTDSPRQQPSQKTLAIIPSVSRAFAYAVVKLLLQLATPSLASTTVNPSVALETLKLMLALPPPSVVPESVLVTVL